MKLAWDDPSKRFAIERHTEGENFARLKLKRDEPPGGADSITGELSWNRTGGEVRIRTFTDVADYWMRNDTPASITDFVPSEPVIAGEGDLAFFSCIDTLFACRVAFPGEKDPISYIVDKFLFREIPVMFKGGLASILKRSRIYAAATVKGDVLNTAYLMIESDARTAVNMLYGLASFALGPSVEIDGWDSAYVISSGDKDVGSILGRRGDFIIFGVGGPAGYGTSRKPPPEIKKIASPSNAFGISVSSAILTAKISGTGETVGQLMEKSLREDGTALDVTANLEKIDSFSLTETPDGRGEMYITLKELEK
jgi:hypothetical protein